MGELIKLPSNDLRWLSLIEKEPTATIFHHPAWIDLLSASYSYRPFIFAILDKDGQIRAGLPIAEINNHLTSRRFVSLPFSDYCAPVYLDDESLCLLTDALVEQQRARRFPRVEIRSALPAQAGIQAKSTFVFHSVLLETNHERVAKRATRQQIQNVRTAEKNGIRIVRSTDLDGVRAFYRLHSLSRRKHGVPVQPWTFFKTLTQCLLEKGLGFVLLAYQAETCISAGLFLHWQKTLTYKYSATDEASLCLRPNHLVTWTAMQWGCESGFTNFDFGRTDMEDEGLREYKRRWGAEETSLSYSYIPSASAPEASGNGRLGTLLKELIRHSPVWVCQILGEMMYRYAG